MIRMLCVFEEWWLCFKGERKIFIVISFCLKYVVEEEVILLVV